MVYLQLNGGLLLFMVEQQLLQKLVCCCSSAFTVKRRRKLEILLFFYLSEYLSLRLNKVAKTRTLFCGIEILLFFVQ